MPPLHPISETIASVDKLAAVPQPSGSSTDSTCSSGYETGSSTTWSGASSSGSDEENATTSMATAAAVKSVRHRKQHTSRREELNKMTPIIENISMDQQNFFQKVSQQSALPEPIELCNMQVDSLHSAQLDGIKARTNVYYNSKGNPIVYRNIVIFIIMHALALNGIYMGYARQMWWGQIFGEYTYM